MCSKFQKAISRVWLIRALDCWCKRLTLRACNTRAGHTRWLDSDLAVIDWYGTMVAMKAMKRGAMKVMKIKTVSILKKRPAAKTDAEPTESTDVAKKAEPAKSDKSDKDPPKGYLALKDWAERTEQGERATKPGSAAAQWVADELRRIDKKQNTESFHYDTYKTASNKDK